MCHYPNELDRFNVTPAQKALFSQVVVETLPTSVDTWGPGWGLHQEDLRLEQQAHKPSIMQSTKLLHQGTWFTESSSPTSTLC